MLSARFFTIRRWIAPLLAMLALPAAARAQSTVFVSDQASLSSAIVNATAGDTIVFTNNITLTSELPGVGTSVVIDGGNFTLSGNGQFRGLFIGQSNSDGGLFVAAAIQNLTISNTVATGGAGGTGFGAGGGGAGLGGAIFVGDAAAVSVSNVHIASSSAVGGAGGTASAVSSGGGGGGLGGAGGAGSTAGGGGGGVGISATGGAADTAGGAGIMSADQAGSSSDGVATTILGGSNAGGGAGGITTSFPPLAPPVPYHGGGAGGGADGQGPFSGGDGGFGGFGGGGGGESTGCLSSGCTGGTGGYAGGGGGAAFASSAGGAGGFGGGGGGSTDDGTNAASAFAGGTGNSLNGNAGGGAGLGGAVFVESGGTFIVSGAFTVNGSLVGGGAAGGAGATAGSAFGSGIFLDGSGFGGPADLTVNSSSDVTIADDIADGVGSGGTGSGTVTKSGTGTLFLQGSNTYTGGTTIDAGTISVSSNANLGSGSLSVNDGGTLAITGSGAYNHSTFLQGKTTFNVASGRTASWLGNVADNSLPGTLNVAGGGTLILGDATNSYSGGTAVTGGSTVSVAADGALGSSLGGVTLGDASSSGTLALTTNGAFVTGRAVNLGAGGGTVDTAAPTNALFLGDLTGTGSLTKTGAGTLTLAGDSSFSGATIVNGGTLFAGLNGVFGTAPTLQIGSAGTVDFSGYSQTINTLSGTGQLALSGGATMTIGMTNLDSTFAGAISGSGGIVKGGSGTFTLSGNNTFAGGIFVLGGTLAASSDANLGGSGGIGLSDATLALTSTNTFAHDLVLFGVPTVNVSSGANATWNGLVLDGSPGSVLHVGGGGTLALTNLSNNYSGGTLVNGGSTVLVGADSALGAPGADIQLGDGSSGGTLALNSTTSLLSSRPITLGGFGGTIDTIGGTNVTLDGAISGGGSLTKTGGGTLTLAGANSYGGSTIVAAGTLRAGRTNVFGASGNMVIDSGATVDLNGFSQNFGSLTGGGGLALNGGASIGLGGNNSSFTFGGALSGNGGVVKNGGGVLTLTGANTYTGGTTVAGGTLLGNSTSLQGGIVNNATVVFDQGSDGTYAGVMSGSGVLGKVGTGSLLLTGANTYAGGTLVSDGTLVGSTTSLQGTIENESALVFDQAGDGVFNGIIFGTGTITKTGPGGLTFGGGTPVGGAVLVNQGILNFSGVLAGDVNIGPGAGLSGAGVIGGSLNLGGSIFVPAPGTLAASFNARRLGVTAAAEAIAVPSLVIGGDLNATPGSTLNFTVTPNGAPPIVVNGTATLTNTHVNVGSTLTNLPRYSTYLGMTASSIVNNGVDASSPLPGIVPALTFDKQTMYVTMLNENIPLQVVAPGPNAGPVGAALDRVKKSATGDLAFVIRELTALNDQQLNNALQQLSGELHATKVRLAVDQATQDTDLIRDEISARDASDDEGRRVTGKQSIRWWFELTGDHATYSPDNADHAVANTGGGAGGFDFNPSSRLTFGAGGSFSRGVMSMLGLGGSSSLNAPRAFGYGGLRFGPFGIHGGGSSAANSYHSERPIDINATVPTATGDQPLSDGVNRTATGDQNGVTRDQWSEWQDTVRVGTWTMESKVGWRRATYGRDQFAETGASAISLLAAAQDLTTKEADVNIHTYRRSGSWRPNLQINFRRELGDDLTNANMQFTGQPTTDFQVNGVPIAQDQLHIIAGLTMRTALGVEYTIEYETLQATNENHQGVHFRIRFR